MALDFLNNIFGNNTEQWAMSSVDNEFGLSLPENHADMTPLPDGFFDSSKDIISDFSAYLPSSDGANASMPSIANKTNEVLGDYLGGLKAKAQKNQFWGATLKTAASAGNLFTALLANGMGRANIDRERRNTRMSVENRMQALDNQVLYYKNQITDKFNTLLARNTVSMATKNLRVSASALLEQTKDAAYDATKDIQMLESNAELKKIALRNEEKQSKISAKLAKSQLTANVLKGMADLGLMVASGGGTFESWGDLYAGLQSANDFEAIKAATASGSLADLY